MVTHPRPGTGEICGELQDRQGPGMLGPRYCFTVSFVAFAITTDISPPLIPAAPGVYDLQETLAAPSTNWARRRPCPVV
jgi:hypothetical protein